MEARFGRQIIDEMAPVVLIRVRDIVLCGIETVRWAGRESRVEGRSGVMGMMQPLNPKEGGAQPLR